MTLRRVVVVGNGIAGLTACDSLRSAGFDGDLTIVGDEHHQPYSRPALSKALLHTDEPGAHLLARPTHEATEVLGIAATGLDVERRLVQLEGGEALPYDGLVIASGSRARRVLTEPAVEGDGVELTLRTIEDAVRLKQRVMARPSVVVIGGGPLGMEVASGALHAGCEVIIISDGPPLIRQLGAHLSGIFTAAANDAGLRIRTGKARIALVGGAPRVLLNESNTIEADLIISAVGDRPNTDWLEGSGLLSDGTLRADSRGRIRPDIVAAGDVTSFPTRRGLRRVPLWTSAIDQARSAAVGLLRGEDAPEFDFQSYFWTEAFGLSLKSVGDPTLGGTPDFEQAGLRDDAWLMAWSGENGMGAAAAINHRIPVPKLRRLALLGRTALLPVPPVAA